MRDEPAGAALLDAARRALLEEVVPGLTGRPRYVALMVANALGIAGREIEAGAALGEAEARALAGLSGPDPAAALVRAIRDGARDADPALHAALAETAARAAAVWKPGRPA
ncbi:DUF6285 domain-containing protein [Methylobacterium sp. NEAU 140]|uniref:DUF6285 domain-containing protein n=1 Tax=Methylobacterium sp. NEAU 140 TaxID=3064945 RepID=UPI00273712CA|nr:DUF6285 domain-containing protein [Methylobacterium sp. NEAU 140]MDP4025262.1 DUF6285 domain-containing protein [Methylobacterium sp. NEAU 140]